MLPKQNILVEQFKTKLIENGFIGEFYLDYPTRLLNATDNSIYELLPEAVIQPSHEADVERIVKLANQALFSSLSFAPRGGGTGTNGQSLTNKIVIDFSRFMNKVLDFKPESNTITVEPGVILADLNRMLQMHGLFFAPDVSTANRATIGGMIATDAAGKGSLIYGKTSDHILNLNVILADGTKIRTENLNSDKLIDKLKIKTPESGIYQQLIELLKPVQNEIQDRFPKLKRPLSGYNIRQTYTEKGFDLSRLICGSEGTLGFVTSATLKLTPIPKFKTLIVIHYNSFIDALKDAQFLIKHEPLAIEAVDEKVQKSAQTLPNWPILAKMLNSVDKNYVSNFMELADNSSDNLNSRVDRLIEDLNKANANYVVIKDANQISQLWSIRSLAVGLAGKMPGEQKPVAFVEDAIVPPENLAGFVKDLQDMLGNQGLNYAMYGHVDVGCIHVRPALNMQDKNDRQKIRPITEEFITLLEKYKGILWGEHGKGFRGEFVPDVFGPILYPVLCKIKAIFDPNNRLNTGKLASPDKNIKLTRIEKVPMRGEFDEIIPKTQQYNYNGAMMCNGNGVCFNKEPSNVMCPSYKITNDRVHSPKGRAMLVKQWLREKASGGEHKKVAQMVVNAMNGCLGCKGCAGKCPTQVSIPDLRTSFLYNYHNEYKSRNLRELLSGYIEHIMPIIGRFPKTWNFLTSNKLLPTFGMNEFPKFNSGKKLSSVLDDLEVTLYTNKDEANTLEAGSVVIYVDAFTGLLEQRVLIAFIKIAKKIGLKPYVIPPSPSGKALIVGGMLKQFKKNTERLRALFTPLFENNIPLVSLENTMALMFRDEVGKYTEPFKGRVLTIAEFIYKYSDKLNGINLSGKYKLLPHCTEQAIHPEEAIHWKNIYTSLGADLEVKNLGCCGMAGNYGYQSENTERSRGLFDLNWEESVSNIDKQALATGFSCRSQAKKQVNVTILHPLEILASNIK